jgi:hypothetical protein
VSAKTQSYARRYIERGFAPIPVPAGSKNPNRPDWESERSCGDPQAALGALCGDAGPH